jgi:hypothetical protein
VEAQENAKLSLRKAYYEYRRLDIYDIIMVFYNRPWHILFWKDIRPKSRQDVMILLKSGYKPSHGKRGNDILSFGK